MGSIENAYKQVSGIDIEEQKRIWDERGKGYYGEYLVFNHLYTDIPGMSKILMNCEIPAEGNKTTEIDLILIHETGMYSFEMKHYKGDIYVNLDGDIWTQYFRTQSNEVFHNPIRQNEYHITALKKLFPDEPVFSFVVFTNDDCRLRINGSVRDECDFQDGKLCTISSLADSFSRFTSGKESLLSPEKIDEIFNTLKPYSKLQNASVKRDGEIVPILDYFSQFSQAFRDQVKQTKEDYKELTEKLEKETQEVIRSSHKKSILSMALALIAIIACIGGIIIIPKARINSAEEKAENAIAQVENKYREFFSKFDDANSVVTENIVTEDLARIEALDIRPVSGIKDSLSISFELVGVKGDYALGLTPDTRLIVRFSNGEVKECDFYYDAIGEPGCILRSNAWFQFLGHGGFPAISFKNILITEINHRSIEYIKLNNIAAYIYDSGNNPLLTDVEFEVYKAE